MKLPIAEPQELFVWHLSWPRWYGTPEQIAAIARKADGDVRANFHETPVATFLQWAISTRSTTSRDPASYADDLRAHRDSLKSAHIRILVNTPDGLVPTEIEKWPAKTYIPPASGFATEDVQGPILVLVELNAWSGASVKVMAPGGITGSRFFDNVEPYVRVGAGRLPWAWLYRGAVKWLLPRLSSWMAVGGGSVS